jgi:hypothetical protein
MRRFGSAPERLLASSKFEAVVDQPKPGNFDVSKMPWRKSEGGARAGRRHSEGEAYFAATTMISTVNCGAASLASTVARAGVLPGDTQLSHAAFISPKVFMSVM